MKFVSTHFPDLDAVSQRQIWLGLASLGRSEADVVELLDQIPETDSRNIQNWIFDHNLNELSGMATGKPVVGIWWNDYSGPLGTQFTALAERLSSETRIDYLGIVSSSYLDFDAEKKINDFNFGQYLAVPSAQDNAKLKFLDLVFISENYHLRT